MQRGLKDTDGTVYQCPLHSLVSMQRGLKDGGHHARCPNFVNKSQCKEDWKSGCRVCRACPRTGLNAKRIESSGLLWNGPCGRRRLNAKRIESGEQHVSGVVLKRQSQCKEDWKFCYYPPSPQPWHDVSMQRGLKVSGLTWTSCPKAGVSMQRGLKVPFPPKTFLPRPESQCKEDWKVNFSSILLSPFTLVSMQRGLKENLGLPAPQGEYNQSQCKEDWKSPLLSWRSFRQLPVSMQRGLKGGAKGAIRGHQGYVSQCKEDWK